ncbi:MAG: hypothetical protein Q8L21_00325, partial [Candidatus Komeilibacteria bacterium]|nr:hypothetical protein [Candidatus Komeilibacteria bacterium]
MKHSTRKKIIGACIIGVVVFGVYFSNWLFFNNGVQTRDGVMRHVDRGGWQVWGIETKKKSFG